jgi:glycine/D-amino acid oxidase-like deaminating enzyme
LALEELEPSLADRFHQGLFLPHEGQLDNRQLLASLLHALGAMQVKLHWNQQIDPDDLHRQGKHDWCRPTLKDNLPEIRISKPGLMLINGLYRHGFLIAPAVMDCAIELMHHSAADPSLVSSALAKRLDLRVTHGLQRELLACAS